MKAGDYHRIPAILEHGITPQVIPKFFGLMEDFRIKIVKKWFESITYQDLDTIKKYHTTFGIPIDLPIERKLCKQILETKFEHLQGASGLVIASLVGSVSIVKYFIDNGANIEFKCKFGDDTALLHAGNRGNVDVVKYLCDVGADINATTSHSEMYAHTTSPVAFEALVHEKLDVLEYLTYFGADIYCDNNNGTEFCCKGPKNTVGKTVSVIHLCLAEEGKGLKEIKNGLKKRFDLIKQCLSKHFPSDMDIMSNIGLVICDQFLNPTQQEYINWLQDEHNL